MVRCALRPVPAAWAALCGEVHAEVIGPNAMSAALHAAHLGSARCRGMPATVLPASLAAADHGDQLVQIGLAGLESMLLDAPIQGDDLMACFGERGTAAMRAAG